MIYIFHDFCKSLKNWFFRHVRLTFKLFRGVNNGNIDRILVKLPQSFLKTIDTNFFYKNLFLCSYHCLYKLKINLQKIENLQKK